MNAASFRMAVVALGTLCASGRGARADERPPVVTPGDPAIEKVMRELEPQRARNYNVPREDGRFLHVLVKLLKARRVLEIGTSNGYSALWLARALATTGGQLTTIDIDPEKVKQARANLKAAGLVERVTLLEGDAHKVARTLAGPFDIVFIDAEKGGELDYFQAVFPKVVPGGAIVVHNAIRFRQAMQDYLDTVEHHPALDTVILSLTMEDGFAVSYKAR
jgi:predicted O-methyltransferase YrrM